MNEHKKELISKNKPLAHLSTGLASRGLQVARQLAQRSYQEFTNSIGMKLVLIPKGSFQMGSPIEEEGYFDEDQHQVTITKEYHLGVTEVTQGQYFEVMRYIPSEFQDDEVAECHSQTGNVFHEFDGFNYPVGCVSWEDAVEFCKKLSDLPKEKKAGREYRLPTEAEWEYACRAGSKTAYSFGDNAELLDKYAWFESNSGDQTHPVAEKKPNAWGLYDMHGNVCEWCSDWYGEYPKNSVSDPTGPQKKGRNA